MRVLVGPQVPSCMYVRNDPLKGSDYDSFRIEIDLSACISWEDDRKEYRQIEGVTYSRYNCYSPISPYGWAKED